jgi:phosphoribosyl 1,2-cyclic phosphodiesterase
MRFCVLASGSGGNACYVETREVRVLVDAGLSCRELVRRLDQIAVRPESLDGLLITHEHDDHIRGAGPLARRFDLPLYMTARCFQAARRKLGNLSAPMPFQTGGSLTIGDLEVESFTKCHDAADPVGLVISIDGFKLGVATDMGRSTRLVEDRLRNCRALILEFNHDLQMLEEGPYPLELKRRIKGRDGHLSNRQAGELLRTVSHQDLEILVLAHLSETNNLPSKALLEVNAVLNQRGLRQAEVYIADQHSAGPLIELK